MRRQGERDGQGNNLPSSGGVAGGYGSFCFLTLAPFFFSFYVRAGNGPPPPVFVAFLLDDHQVRLELGV